MSNGLVFKMGRLFFYLVTGYWLLVTRVYADSLSRAEALYLQGSYSESIDECAANIMRNRERDKAYYLLGLNYLKINDTEKAREKLKILSDNFSDSQYLEAAKLAYADTYFVDQDYPAAQRLYEALTKSNGKLQSAAYFRLAQCALKSGQWQEARQYAGILQQKYPLSLEAASSGELFKENEFFFTVQVGCFASFQNAQRLLNKLKAKNLDAYIDELGSSGSLLYRVRVGKVKTRQEAETFKNQLEKEGYPTRIFP